MPPAELKTLGPWKFVIILFKLSHSLWKRIFPYAVTICGLKKVDISSVALAWAVYSSKPKSYDSQCPRRLLSMFVSCLLRYRCRRVVQSKMCFGNFHSPSVTERQISCPIDSTRRLAFWQDTSGFPAKTMLRNFISSLGRSSDVILISSAGGAKRDLPSHWMHVWWNHGEEVLHSYFYLNLQACMSRKQHRLQWDWQCIPRKMIYTPCHQDRL